MQQAASEPFGDTNTFARFEHTGARPRRGSWAAVTADAAAEMTSAAEGSGAAWLPVRRAASKVRERRIAAGAMSERYVSLPPLLQALGRAITGMRGCRSAEVAATAIGRY